MYQTMNSVFNLLQLVIILEQNECVEVSVANMPDDGASEFVLSKILLRLLHKFRKARYWDTARVSVPYPPPVLQH